MDMREKMARAIWAVEHPYTSWDRAPQWMKDRYFAAADAALSALEEPTDEMWEAGYATDYFPGSTWDAMIRKAKEG
jgi:hypothetical protein